VAGFLGLNGAGKTTAMRIISSYMPPTSGGVRVDGCDTVRQSSEVTRRIGYLPERVPLYEDMRVREYLRFRARLKGVRARDTRSAVDRVIDRCGLSSKAGSVIATLSKGYRQRVGIADALVHAPSLLILDEPTSGLDPDQRREIRSLIRELGDESTVLLSTHILPEAEAVCSRVIIIHSGRIRASDTLANLQQSMSGVLVRYEGPPLEGHRDRSEQGEGQTILRLRSAAEGSEAVAAAVHAGRRVLEFSTETPSLERIFIQITTGRDDA